MGKYDNYSNVKKIEKIQKKLDKLLSKKKTDLFKIDLVKNELKTMKLFEHCQIFGNQGFFTKSQADPNEFVMFSDDNKVLLFGDKLIKYSDISSYKIIEKYTDKTVTTTKKNGALSRAVVGGAISGSLGALIGVASAEETSDTTYYKSLDGLAFQLFLKNGEGYQMDMYNIGDFISKPSKKWVELTCKLQMIIDVNK